MTMASDSLATARLGRLREALHRSGCDALLVTTPANVQYACGYRSVAGSVHGTSSISVLLTAQELLVIGPVGDSAPAFDAGIPEESFVAFGRFYFESQNQTTRAPRLSDNHADRAEAIESAIGGLELARASIATDLDSDDPLRHDLKRRLPETQWTDATWVGAARAVKFPGEVNLLERSAQITEDGIVQAIEAAKPGMTERDLAKIVARTMIDGGGEPRFVVVTSGPRSALSDAYATDRPIEGDDLIRFDVGCTLEGYWSDIGRTAVIGTPSERQRRYYGAILAAEQAQLDLAAPGVTARELFQTAIDVTESKGGPRPYRRHHCGHGIGLTAYEPPIIAPQDDGVLKPGMVFCFETPYYEIGWGGMMIEDALVVTESGARLLTDRSRELSVVTS